MSLSKDLSRVPLASVPLALEELCMDTVWGTRSLVQSVTFGVPQALQELHADILSSATSFLLHCLHSGTYAMVSATGSKIRKSALCDALAELADDAAELAKEAGVDRSQLIFPAMMMLAPPVTPHPALVLAGVALPPAAMIHGGVACIFLAGAWSFSRRWPGSAGARLPSRTGALVCLSAAAVQFLQLWFGLHGYPTWITDCVSSPYAALHYLGDLVAMPLLELNLAYLSGCSMGEVLPAVMISSCTTMSGIASTALPSAVSRAACLGTSLLGISMTACLLQPIITKALNLSANNKERARISGDLLIITWTLFPVAQAIEMAGLLPAEAIDIMFVGLDTINKMGVGHIMLKSASALDCSHRFLTGQSEGEKV
mmetsp:Transcript_4372/g.7504  ORF Transcript_4372/g.7504 Transcript_4372/m.7504 type:complete len:372 (+) Transcript_4372:145-1260(+)